MPQLHKFQIIIPPQDIEVNPQCLQRMAEDDSSALDWLYKNYSGRVYNYAFLITSNRQLSEDIVQDTFVKLWKNRNKLKTVKDFNAYFYRLYQNQVLDAMRAQQKEKQHHSNYQSSTTAYLQPDELLLHKEQTLLIRKAVNQLPPQRQLIYKMVREYKCSREEVAASLHISPLTVKVQVQLGLKFLKNYLNGQLK